MRVNNNYIRVVATFIGEDGSREFKKGTIYILKMKITDSYIIVSSENNESLWCPYGSMNTFLENWKLNEDEMTELKKTEKYSQPWMPNITDSLIDIIDKQLVAIPQIVADYIETQKGKLKIFGALKGIAEQRGGYELYRWVFASEDSQELFARAWLDGYTVEKEKKYILKHIDLSEQDNEVSLYLSHGLYKELQHERYSKDVDMSKIKECHFTQSEIDKLNIGSYEQIEVKVEEVEK